jgi:DNA-binding transcriptional ArsR family regulator
MYPGPKAVNQSLQRFKAEFFKALAHPTRIRILELLRHGEKSVGELQQALASEGSTVSQQLAILRMKNLVDTRKSGNSIYYRLRDPQVNDLLDVARRIFESHVIELRAMTEEPDRPAASAHMNESGATKGPR